MRNSLKMRRISALVIAGLAIAKSATSAVAADKTAGALLYETGNACIPPAPASGASPEVWYNAMWGECRPLIIFGIAPATVATPSLPEPVLSYGTSSSYSSYSMGGCDVATGSGTVTITSGSFGLPDSPAGFGWMQNSRPEIELVFGDTNRDEDGSETKDRIILYLSATQILQFQRSDDSTLFYGINGAMGAFKLTKRTGSPLTPRASTWDYYDRDGNISTFFGFDTHSNDIKVRGQLWRVRNMDARTGFKVSYLGHATDVDTAIDDGFVQDGSSNPTARPAKWVDSAGREILYAYNGDNRYQTITTNDLTGGSHEVQKITFAYYTTRIVNVGDVGDLKTVKTTHYLSGGVTQETTEYMRYYTLDNADPPVGWKTAQPGHPHQLRLKLDAEGYRRWKLENPADDPEDETDATLKPFASQYITYYDAEGDKDGTPDGSDVPFRKYKVWEYTSNTDCGCSGTAPTDTVELDYSDNLGSLDPAVYDASGAWGTADWTSRSVQENPDGSYKTYYFDEYGQKLAEVISDGAPTGSPHFWVTRYERDSVGRVAKVFSPESIASFTFSTGAMTINSGDGLINYMEYDSAVPGMAVSETRHGKGSSGPQKLDTRATYESGGGELRVFGTGSNEVFIVKPLTKSSSVYKNEVTDGSETAADCDTTDFTYTFYTSWLIKSVARTAPIVDADNNGSETSDATTYTYLREDGRPVFSRTADDRYTYFDYSSTTAQMVTRVTDMDNGTGSVNTQATSFGLTLPSAGKKISTTYTYDEQGRNATTTLPTGRVMATWHTKLYDNRSVTLSVPRVVSTTYYGPVSYSVTNLAGKSEASGIITLVGSNNEAGTIASWIDNATNKDPIQAVSSTYGAVARLNVTEYIKNGTKPTKSRAIYNLDTTVSASDSDDSYVYYDSMGRVIRRVDATGTISRTVFDAIGRPYTQWVGTNDNGWAQGSTSGTDNMTETSRLYFDGATSTTLAVGNHRLTSRKVDEDGDWTTTTGDQRTTSMLYDYRGRMIVQTKPVAPHNVSKYDNRGRRITSGTFSSTSGMTAGTDPTSTTTNRLSLNETFFDERGQVWKSLQHKVSQSAGTYSGGDDMITLNWYDKNGRSIKSTGPGGLRKIAYDRLDRVERQYSLAKITDSTYADADDVDGDIVLDEQLTNFDDASGVVLASISLTRLEAATTSYTGDLRDTNTTPGVVSDTDLAVSSTVHARAQITAMYYDDLDRPVNTVQLGTYGLTGTGSSTFTRSSYSLPSRSDTALVTTTTYNKDGTVLQVEEPRTQVISSVDVPLRTRFAYDHAGRKITTISNYVDGTPTVGGSEDNYVRTVYTNGLMTKLWVDLDGDNAEDLTSTTQDHDQVTVYNYDTTKGTLSVSGSSPVSQVARKNVLASVTYPPQTSSLSGSPGSTDLTVIYAYNALGEQVLTKDQNGTVIKTVFDLGGRILQRQATTVGSGVDDWVERIVLAYTNRGQTETVIQYDDPTAGTALNGIKYTYDDWGNVTQLDQDFDSAVVASGNEKSVSWSYLRVAPTEGRLSYRRTGMTLADGKAVTYGYGTSGGLDDLAGRVQTVSLNITGSSAVEVAAYTYMGGRTVTNKSLPEVSYSVASGPSQLDRFNRVVTDKWINGSSNAVQEFDITYDRNSNIEWVKDPVLDNWRSTEFVNSFSTKFEMDGRNRVVKADRGEEVSGAIDGSQRLNQLWTLSQTGNWTNFKNDFNGDNDGTDGIEVNDTRTFSDANEILTRSEPSATTALSKSGEMTDDGTNFEYKYDAFGRLKKVTTRSDVLVAEYTYNGLNQRIGWHYDTTRSGGGLPDDVVDSNDPWYFFTYDDRWRIVNTFHVSSGTIDTYAKERFVHHSAGLDGRGGSSYVDSMILADRDLSTGWVSSADSSAEKRFYYLQNWRADVCAITNDAGLVLRNFRYSAYGSRTEVDGGDYNRDGTADFFDYLDYVDAYSLSDMRADINKDGSLTGADTTAMSTLYSTDDDLLGGTTRNLYAGYENDPSLEKLAVSSGGDSALVAWESMYHVRNRVYSTELGRWTRRDPLGYHDGMGLYEYVRAMSVKSKDAYGLAGDFGLSRADTGEKPWICGTPFRQPLYEEPDAVDPLDPYRIVCSGNPWVEAAVKYVNDTCRMSTICRKWKIKWEDPGNSIGWTGCQSCTIKMKPFPFPDPFNPDVLPDSRMCGILAHELVHAGDTCVLGICDGEDFGGKYSCINSAYSEGRANAVSCCDEASNGGRDFETCMNDEKKNYKDKDMYTKCPGAFDVYWNLGKNEIKCNNPAIGPPTFPTR